MVICKSEIEWHSLEEPLDKDEPILIIFKEDGVLRVSPCRYDDKEKVFYDPTGWQLTIYRNVKAWAYFPIVHIVGIDFSGKYHIFTSDGFF